MKDNKGFVLIETMVVLTVTMISLLTLYSAYILILKNAQQKQYYDNINDVYKANVVLNLSEENKLYEFNNTNGYVAYTPSNCSANGAMVKDCSELFNNLDITYAIYTKKGANINQSDTNIFVNTFKKYISSIDTNNANLIIIRDVNDKKYYASIVVGENNE